MFNISKKKIWVAGHNGMVGSAIVRRLESEECKILKVNSKELNLLDYNLVNDFLKINKPEHSKQVYGKALPIHFKRENIRGDGLTD